MQFNELIIIQSFIISAGFHAVYPTGQTSPPLSCLSGKLSQHWMARGGNEHHETVRCHDLV